MTNRRSTKSPPDLAESLLALPRKQGCFLDKIPANIRGELLKVQRYFKAGKYAGISMTDLYEGVCDKFSLGISLSTFKNFLNSRKYDGKTQKVDKPR